MTTQPELEQEKRDQMDAVLFKTKGSVPRGNHGRCGPGASAGPAGEWRPESSGQPGARSGAEGGPRRASWPRADAPCFPHAGSMQTDWAEKRQAQREQAKPSS
mgnify:CR=1 FL=1